MQRLVLAVVLVALVAGIVAVLTLGWRDAMREKGRLPAVSEGTQMQKLAFAALFLLIAGVATGLLGGL